MSRSERLLTLLQLLRRHRFAVSATQLAKTLGISVRTVYRDIDALRAQGARIEGESGVGYLLRQDFLLPPLTLSAEEAEALLLGVRWVAKHGDAQLVLAAQQAFAKIERVLPAELRVSINQSPLLVGSRRKYDTHEQETLAQIRHAIRLGRKVDIRYCDAQDTHSDRTIWPFAVGYFDQTRVVAAWCEMRRDFRHFRTDRITKLLISDECTPESTADLLARWHAQTGIPTPYI